MQQIVTGKRRERIDTEVFAAYPCRLQMYLKPPVEELSLDEFEHFALDRVKALKTAERARVRDPHRKGEFNGLLKEALRKYLPLDSTVHLQLGDEKRILEQRRKDHISHYILRLAYCRSEDLRRWFLAQECELFRFRCENEDSVAINAFLEYNDLHYKPIPAEEKQELWEHLSFAAHTKEMKDALSTVDFFRVPFESVIELVARRQVYIRNGIAYVPRTQLVSILVGAFRTRLSAALVSTAKVLPLMEEDERVLPMLNNMSKQYLGNSGDWNKVKGTTITADQIDGLSKKSFPLCMRGLHDSLLSKHHLKHWGRQQYGLFIKGIGISLEEAMVFWRTEFTKSMTVDKFEKSHSYNIRHNYGQEGKRTDYTPYSCMKIIMSNAPGAGDDHGCPFKHSDAAHLKAKLNYLGIAPSGTSDILDLVKNQHYQIACQKYFELTHKVLHPGFTVEHPNQFFSESQKVLTGTSDAISTMTNGGFAAASPGGSALLSPTRERMVNYGIGLSSPKDASTRMVE